MSALGQKRTFCAAVRNVVVRSRCGHGDFAGIGELDGVANEIDQDLRQAPTVTAARGQLRSHLDFEQELFVGCQRLQRAANFNSIRDAIQAKHDHIPDQHNDHHSGDGEP